MKIPEFKINLVALIKMFRKYILREKAKPLYGMGYLPDKKDPRDVMYKVSRPGLAPPSTNRKNVTEFTHRYDQGNLGSCVGHGVVAAFRRVLQVNKQPDYQPSRLFAYYIARQDKQNDTGATIRDGMKAVNRFGICSESLWPYVIRDFTKEPSLTAFAEAGNHQSIRYARLPQTKEAIMDAVSQGFPVVYGKQLYESFMSDKVARTGIVPIPKTCYEQHYGGHCMTIFDYDEKGTVELNSWGRDWGQGGVCHVPWDYVLNPKLCSDFWAIYQTE